MQPASAGDDGTDNTGSFLLVNTGTTRVRTDAGLLATVAWQSPSGELTYALETALPATDAVVRRLHDGLQGVRSTEAIAGEVREALETIRLTRPRGAPPTSCLRVDGTAGALGAAFLAGLGVGLWSSTDELRARRRLDRVVAPAGDGRSGVDPPGG